MPAPHALQALVYVSAARVPMTEQALQDLLQRARDNNLREGVTGALLHCDGSFMQYLEGTPEAMDRVCALIRADHRHHGLVDIFSGPVAARAFSGWAMAYVRTHKAEFVRLSRANCRTDVGADVGGDSLGLNLLLDFWDRHHGARSVVT